LEDTNRIIQELVKKLDEAEQRISQLEKSGAELRMIETALRRSEETLRYSEKKLRDITSSLGEGIYVLDEHWNITFMNEEAERLFGWTHEELAHKNAHELVHHKRADGSALPAKECPVHHVVKTGKRFVSTEEVFVRKDGTVFPVSIIASPIVEDGRVVASVTAFRDITEHKRLENELLKAQKLESVGFLAGGIAHDFNNLLQAILGNISLAKIYCRPGDKIYRRLTEAENASMQATDLSYRLLTFSKGGEPFKQITSIEGVITKAVKFTLSGSNVTCEFDIHDSCHKVEIDEGQITQVIHNLVMNAREAMPEGGTVRVSAENVAISDGDPPLEAGEYLMISITDQGIGISEEDLQKIFDPYYTTKVTGSRKGSGLGLSICHSIIKKHKGLITVSSRRGTGTTFHVYLPAHKPKVFEEEADREMRSGRGRILLMDDEEIVRNIGGEILEYLGYEVELAEDGNKAVDLYRQLHNAGTVFYAVILDLTIPGGAGGDKAIKKILEIDPTAKGIVSSGYADDPVMRAFREHGFVAAIAKPYSVEQISKVLDSIDGESATA